MGVGNGGEGYQIKYAIKFAVKFEFQINNKGFFSVGTSQILHGSPVFLFVKSDNSNGGREEDMHVNDLSFFVMNTVNIKINKHLLHNRNKVQ